MNEDWPFMDEVIVKFPNMRPNMRRLCNMENQIKLNVCIADINDLLTRALGAYVLQEKEYRVKEVQWNDRELVFTITLEKKVEPK